MKVRIRESRDYLSLYYVAVVSPDQQCHECDPPRSVEYEAKQHVGAQTKELTRMDSYALIYIGSALLGAVVGGAISVAISLWGSRRQRRIRYGENLLDTLNAMKRKLALLQEVGTCSSTQPLVLREEALGFWIQVEFAASLENRSNRRIIRSWAKGIFSGAYQGASSDEEQCRRI